MPVYRAYVNPGEQPSAGSEAIVQEAAGLAATRTDPDAVAKAAKLVLYGTPEAVTRFQQTCGPVMAKGVEDTALYRWYPLACLNEVGGEPDRFGVSPAEFHAFCAGLPPRTMTTLSTHDTKRSEDVRARLAVLSELSEEWAMAVDSWAAAVSFDPKLDYLAWQSLMAAWPIPLDRFTGYLLKAAREAKTSISWLNPDPAYEEGIRDFARRAIEACGYSVASFTEVVDRYARVNSLGQKAVQLLMPGIPDVYQGNEITDFSLVDPDNRRPVDFERRRRLLAEPDDGWDGQKIRVTAAALGLRQRLDPEAPYAPIEAGSTRSRSRGAFPGRARPPSWSRPGCRSGWSAGADGGATRSRCRRGAGATCSPAPSTRVRCGWPTCCPRARSRFSKPDQWGRRRMFEVWAPEAARVEVEHGGARHEMTRGGGGRWTAPGDEHDLDYAFFVDGAGPFPDPLTRRQPYGVNGPSRVYHHDRFAWTDQGWHGRDLRGGVIYELHVGTFSPEGTFRGWPTGWSTWWISGSTSSRSCRCRPCRESATGATTAWSSTRSSRSTAGRTGSRTWWTPATVPVSA
ncbi:hypothetical protein GCM10027612_28330 [Microbispora bryophytorum subsp. camponoti]